MCLVQNEECHRSNLWSCNKATWPKFKKVDICFMKFQLICDIMLQQWGVCGKDRLKRTRQAKILAVKHIMASPWDDISYLYGSCKTYSNLQCWIMTTIISLSASMVVTTCYGHRLHARIPLHRVSQCWTSNAYGYNGLTSTPRGMLTDYNDAHVLIKHQNRECLSKSVSSSIIPDKCLTLWSRTLHDIIHDLPTPYSRDSKIVSTKSGSCGNWDPSAASTHSQSCISAGIIPLHILLWMYTTFCSQQVWLISKPTFSQICHTLKMTGVTSIRDLLALLMS